MNHRAQTLLGDIAIGLLAGLVATPITDLAQMPLSWLTPSGVERQEKRVRPGASSSLVAGQKAAKVLNQFQSSRQASSLGKVIHYGVGTAWGPVYGLLRRYGGLGTTSAGIASGISMSVILDGSLVPALGLSAANRKYPAFTHLRGVLAHLVYGAAVAIVVEGICRLSGWPMSRSRRSIPASNCCHREF